MTASAEAEDDFSTFQPWRTGDSDAQAEYTRTRNDGGRLWRSLAFVHAGSEEDGPQEQGRAPRTAVAVAEVVRAVLQGPVAVADECGGRRRRRADPRHPVTLRRRAEGWRYRRRSKGQQRSGGEIARGMGNAPESTVRTFGV